MGFFSGIGTSLRAQGEKRKLLKELEGRTASETLRLEKQQLEKEKAYLKDKREVRDLKREVRREKLAPITEKLANVRTNLQKIKDRNDGKARRDVRKGNRPTAETGQAPDIYGFSGRSPFSQDQGRGASAFEIGRKEGNPFTGSGSSSQKPKKKKGGRQIIIKL